MLVSYIIVTYKREDALRRCIDSIICQTYRPLEVIIVDNAGDLEFELCPENETLPVDMQIHHAPRNLGAAGGRNWGMAMASGGVFISVDDDAQLANDQLTQQVVNRFKANPRCGAISFRSIDVNGQAIVVEFPHPDKKLVTRTDVFEVPYFYAMGHAFRPEVIRSTGGYSEYLFYLMEEYELSLRIIEQGYTILYDPQICVIHQQQGNIRHAEGTEWLYRSTLNKARSAFMKLPMPYPLTITLIWASRLFVSSRFNPKWLIRLFSTLFAERRILGELRQPISSETAAYIRSIGGRLLY